MEIARTVKDEPELWDTLKKLSIEHGGAWVHSVRPFSHEVTFKQFKNPSSVPDHFHDLAGNRIAWEGSLRGFTKAAQIREQNRGLGRQ